MSSPRFSLACPVCGAKLSVKAGSGTCPSCSEKLVVSEGGEISQADLEDESLEEIPEETSSPSDEWEDAPRSASPRRALVLLVLLVLIGSASVYFFWPKNSVQEEAPIDVATEAPAEEPIVEPQPAPQPPAPQERVIVNEVKVNIVNNPSGTTVTTNGEEQEFKKEEEPLSPEPKPTEDKKEKQENPPVQVPPVPPENITKVTPAVTVEVDRRGYPQAFWDEGYKALLGPGTPLFDDQRLIEDFVRADTACRMHHYHLAKAFYEKIVDHVRVESSMQFARRVASRKLWNSPTVREGVPKHALVALILQYYADFLVCCPHEDIADKELGQRYAEISVVLAPDADGMRTLGNACAQNRDFKQAEWHLRNALVICLPEKRSEYEERLTGHKARRSFFWKEPLYSGEWKIADGTSVTGWIESVDEENYFIRTADGRTVEYSDLSEFDGIVHVHPREVAILKQEVLLKIERVREAFQRLAASQR